MSPSKGKGPRRRGISFATTIALVILTAATLYWRGYDYYPLSLDERASHPEFRQLRPSGLVGYGYGVFGTLLIFTNLLYLARRKLAGFRLGSMRTWLDLHVFTGMLAAVVVIFHSSFQARSTIAQITATSFVIVVVTGLIGRFIYALVPRPDEQRLADAIDELEARVPGLGPQVKSALAEFPAPRLHGNPSLLHSIRTWPKWSETARARRDAIELVVFNSAAVASLEPRAKKQMRGLCRRAVRAATAEVRGAAAAGLMRSWRSLHRLFAILMLLAVIVHIAVAWHYGYRWVFSE